MNNYPTVGTSLPPACLFLPTIAAAEAAALKLISITHHSDACFTALRPPACLYTPTIAAASSSAQHSSITQQFKHVTLSTEAAQLSTPSKRQKHLPAPTTTTTTSLLPPQPPPSPACSRHHHQHHGPQPAHPPTTHLLPPPPPVHQPSSAPGLSCTGSGRPRSVRAAWQPAGPRQTVCLQCAEPARSSG